MWRYNYINVLIEAVPIQADKKNAGAGAQFIYLLATDKRQNAADDHD